MPPRFFLLYFLVFTSTSSFSSSIDIVFNSPINKTGKEPFVFDGNELPLNVLSFWQWSTSELLGNAEAQRILGTMYIKGINVAKKDLSKGRYWIKKAYENPKASAGVKEDAEVEWNHFELWKY